MNVLMVCLGNICRSPLAEGILREHIQKKGLDWKVDSAGTSRWHVGEKPDPRSIETAHLNGIDITDQRARQFSANDFSNYDLILAMDSANYANIIKLARSEDEVAKVKLILNYTHPGMNKGVPDPYYEGGFQYVYDLLDEAIGSLIEEHNSNG